ncbi:hypothetical protein K435DRAFT_806519 [Dendrothele bispora CBS 962.96]|uniref:Uncharacterized protein n=1 Tax=Dendrothele bispora (strain CBS 962.96) TaxID=1314807 RepID=A0A4S8L7K4_DENBC|nr:hypothetical protein K435DRAFT_806519 [Dendrothele bispora CBS 962.96]
MGRLSYGLALKEKEQVNVDEGGAPQLVTQDADWQNIAQDSSSREVDSSNGSDTQSMPSLEDETPLLTGEGGNTWDSWATTDFWSLREFPEDTVPPWGIRASENFTLPEFPHGRQAALQWVRDVVAHVLRQSPRGGWEASAYPPPGWQHMEPNHAAAFADALLFRDDYRGMRSGVKSKSALRSQTVGELYPTFCGSEVEEKREAYWPTAFAKHAELVEAERAVSRLFWSRSNESDPIHRADLSVRLQEANNHRWVVQEQWDAMDQLKPGLPSWWEDADGSRRKWLDSLLIYWDKLSSGNARGKFYSWATSKYLLKFGETHAWYAANPGKTPPNVILAKRFPIPALSADETDNTSSSLPTSIPSPSKIVTPAHPVASAVVTPVDPVAGSSSNAVGTERPLDHTQASSSSSDSSQTQAQIILSNLGSGSANPDTGLPYTLADARTALRALLPDVAIDSPLQIAASIRSWLILQDQNDGLAPFNSLPRVLSALEDLWGDDYDRSAWYPHAQDINDREPDADTTDVLAKISEALDALRPKMHEAVQSWTSVDRATDVEGSSSQDVGTSGTSLGVDVDMGQTGGSSRDRNVGGTTGQDEGATSSPHTNTGGGASSPHTNTGGGASSPHTNTGGGDNAVQIAAKSSKKSRKGKSKEDEFDRLELEPVEIEEVYSKLGWDVLSPEEFEEKQKMFSFIKDHRIGDFYRREHRRLKGGENDSFIRDIMKEEPTGAGRKPVHTPEVMVFMRQYYDTMIKDRAVKELEEAQALYQGWLAENDGEGEQMNPPCPVSIRYRIAAQVLAEQSDDFRAEIKKAGDVEHSQKLKDWEEAKAKEEAENGTPQGFANAIKKWSPAVARFNNAVAKEMGLCVVTALVGPNPEEGGKVDIWWNLIGENGMGLQWDKFDKKMFEATGTSLIKFGKTVYSSNARAERALGKESSSLVDNNEGSSKGGPVIAKKARPGPGQDSEGRSKPRQPQKQPTRTSPRKRPPPKKASTKRSKRLPKRVEVVIQTPKGKSTKPSSVQTPSLVPPPSSIPPPSSVPPPSAAPPPAAVPPPSSAPPPTSAPPPSAVPATAALPRSSSVPAPSSVQPASTVTRSSSVPPPSSTSGLPSASTDGTNEPPSQHVSKSPTDHLAISETSPTAHPDPEESTVPGPSVPTSNSGEMKREAVCWHHPSKDRFWPELSRYLQSWGNFVSHLPDESWLEEFEELLDIFLQFEQVFKFQEVNGEARSQKEWHMMELWEDAGRPALVILDVDPGLMEGVIEDVTGWWSDFGKFEKDARDFAPLDSTSGKNGVWKLIWAITSILFTITGDPDEKDFTTEWDEQQLTDLAAWTILVIDVKETLEHVYKNAKFRNTRPSKRKAEEVSDTRPMTRSRVAKEAVAKGKAGKKNGGSAKGKGKGKGKAASRT